MSSSDTAASGAARRDAQHPGAEGKSAASEGFDILKTIVYALLIALVLRIVLFQPFTIPSASMEPTLYKGDYIIVSKFTYGWSRNSIPFSPPLPPGRFMGRTPTRGDVVVFKLPRDGHIDYIKRLVGLPGDRMQVRDGVLYINDQAARRTAEGVIPTHCPGSEDAPAVGAPLSMEVLPHGRTHPVVACFNGQGGANDTAVYVVPPNCYFMMGDNRDNSVDSRYPPYPGPASDFAMQSCPWNPAVESALQNIDAGVGFVPAQNLVGKADLILFAWGPNVSLFKPWTWFTDVRLNRWFHLIK